MIGPSGSSRQRSGSVPSGSMKAAMEAGPALTVRATTGGVMNARHRTATAQMMRSHSEPLDVLSIMPVSGSVTNT